MNSTRLTVDEPLLVTLNPGASLATRLVLAATLSLHAIVTWQQRARSRHHLSQIDERMRRDIGLGSADIYRELRKPFWIA